MPTDLQTIAQSAVRVRYKEPLLSEAMNRAQFVQPRGTYRGFNLGTSASALSVTVEVDPVYGDAVAVVHDVDDRALTIRVTDSIELDLSSFASKTVVIAIYARHLSQGTTVAAVRGYELDPTDEYTGDPNVGNLIVLGTVVVPAAGLIAATSITHEKRVVSTDNEFSQKCRIPLVLNHDFQQTGYAFSFNVTASSAYEGQILPVAPHWFVEGSPGSAKERTQYRVEGNGIVIRASTSSDYEVSLYQDILYSLGDIDASNGDWKLHYEVNYDVINVSAGGDGTLEFRIYANSVDNYTGVYLIQKSLDVTTVGTGFVASGLEDLLITPPDAGANLGAAGVARITTIMFAGSDAPSLNDTDLYRINSVQVWLVNNKRTAGHVDPQARGDKSLGWPLLRGLSFFAATNGAVPITADISVSDLPGITISRDSRFGSFYVARLVKAALSVQEVIAVEDNNATSNRNKPRFRGAYNSTLDLTNILEAVSQAGDTADSGLRLVASPNGRLYLAVNADTSNGVWDKDIDGDPAAAIRIDGNSGEVNFLTRAAGAGTWNDSSWSSTVNMLSKGVTATITDGTTFTDGDHNGPNAVDVVQTVYSRGRYFLRTGSHTLSAVSAITNNSVLIGESFGSKPYLFPNAGMVSNQEISASMESIHLRNGTAGNWSFSGRTVTDCTIESGFLIEEFPALQPMKFTNCNFGPQEDTPNNAIVYTLEINTNDSDIARGIIFENCVFSPPAGSTSGVASVGINTAGASKDVGIHFLNCRFLGSADVGANNGMAALRFFNSDTHATFENCRFVGDSDAVFMVEIANAAHESGIVFKDCFVESSSGKCMAIGSNNAANVTLDTVKLVSGTSTPTGGKGQIFFYAGQGRLKVRDLRLVLSTSVVDTGAGPTFPPVEIGGELGTPATASLQYDIDGLSLVLDDVNVTSVPTFTTLVVHPPDPDAAFSSLIKNVDYNVQGLAASNSGVGDTVAAFMEFLGAQGTSGRSMSLENISLRGVDMPTFTDNRAGIWVQNCTVKTITYEGPVSPTVAGGQLHNNNGALAFFESVVYDIHVGEQYAPNFGIANNAMVVYVDESTIIGGMIRRMGGTNIPARCFYQFHNGYVHNVDVATQSMAGSLVFELAGTPTAVMNCRAFASNDPSRMVSGASASARVVGNHFEMNVGTATMVDLTGARGLVDSNILHTVGAGVPTIINSGTGSVTGDNVIT